MLIETTERAMAHCGSAEVLIVGGVGCNLRWFFSVFFFKYWFFSLKDCSRWWRLCAAKETPSSSPPTWGAETFFMQVFLNLPIWANFVDPTDLSLTYCLPTTLEQTSFIGWTQPHPQPQPGLAKQHWLRPSLLDWAGWGWGWGWGKGLAYFSWIVPFIVNTSLYRNT